MNRQIDECSNLVIDLITTPCLHSPCNYSITAISKRLHITPGPHLLPSLSQFLSGLSYNTVEQPHSSPVTVHHFPTQEREKERERERTSKITPR